MMVRIRPTGWLARLLLWLRVPLKRRPIGKLYINGTLAGEVLSFRVNGVPIATSWPLATETRKDICSKCGSTHLVVADEQPVTCISCDIQAIADLKAQSCAR